MVSYFLQIKAIDFTKTIIKLSKEVENNYKIEECKGLFCKVEMTNNFLMGLQKSIGKLYNSNESIKSGQNIQYFLLFSYSEELEKIKFKIIRETEKNFPKKFEIFFPLINLVKKKIIKHKINISGLDKTSRYECIKVCNLCHDIYSLYENKRNLSNKIFTLLDKQVY